MNFLYADGNKYLKEEEQKLRKKLLKDICESRLTFDEVSRVLAILSDDMNALKDKTFSLYTIGEILILNERNASKTEE